LGRSEQESVVREIRTLRFVALLSHSTWMRPAKVSATTGPADIRSITGCSPAGSGGKSPRFLPIPHDISDLPNRRRPPAPGFRLNGGQPPPTKKAQEPSPAQRLLDWLQHWTKPTVRARDICIYGPNSIRDRESAIDSAAILVKEGWLIPIKTRRYDMCELQVVRKPIVHPTVAIETPE
jgi:hypothetical protein